MSSTTRQLRVKMILQPRPRNQSMMKHLQVFSAPRHFDANRMATRLCDPLSRHNRGQSYPGLAPVPANEGREREEHRTRHPFKSGVSPNSSEYVEEQQARRARACRAHWGIDRLKAQIRARGFGFSATSSEGEPTEIEGSQRPPTSNEGVRRPPTPPDPANVPMAKADVAGEPSGIWGNSWGQRAPASCGSGNSQHTAMGQVVKEPCASPQAYT